MNSLLKILAATAAAVGFYGCDAFNLDALKPGISTVQEVRDLLGTPAAEWQNPDGTLTLEYPRGPEGTQCWMLTVTAGGILMRIDQALTEENFARVEKGWSPRQVRRLLGTPASIAKFPLKPEIVWEWRVEPRSPGSRAFFHVHFDIADGLDRTVAGKVTGTSRREESPV